MAKVLDGTDAWTKNLKYVRWVWGRKKGEGIGVFYIITFRCSKVDHVPIFLEHVHFLYGLDGLDIELLQRGL